MTLVMTTVVTPRHLAALGVIALVALHPSVARIVSVLVQIMWLYFVTGIQG
jgi:hypothetical protein